MAGKESEFCTEIVHSLHNLGAWAYKIPDPQQTPGGYIRASARPFDIVATHHSIAIAIECKFQKNWGAFGKQFPEHQMLALEQHKDAGGLSYISHGFRLASATISQTK